VLLFKQLQIGTFQFAVAAKAFNRPMYVAAESYKFARVYPLNQRDIPESTITAAGSPPIGLPTDIAVCDECTWLANNNNNITNTS
jgi:hypothetical protein